MLTCLRTVPPIGVYAVAGCGADLLINILLTCLGYVLSPSPNRIHHTTPHHTDSIPTATSPATSTPSTSSTSTTTVASRRARAASRLPAPRASTVSACRVVGRVMARLCSLFSLCSLRPRTRFCGCRSCVT